MHVHQDVELNDGVTAYKSKRVDSGVQIDFLTRVDRILFHSFFQFSTKADNEQQRGEKLLLTELNLGCLEEIQNVRY